MSLIKKEYYSDTKNVEDYDYKRFGRGGGPFVLKKEEEIVRSLIEKSGLINGVILDCPTGTGRFIPLLKNYSNKLICADISLAMLERAVKYNADTYHHCSAENLPLEDGAIDLWLMSRFCFHFQNLSPFFKEAARVISTNGFLIIDTFNWSPRSLLPSFLLGGKTFNHSKKHIQSLIDFHGFELVSTVNVFAIPTYISAFLPSFFVINFEKIVDKLMPTMKTKSYYLIRKKKSV